MWNMRDVEHAGRGTRGTWNMRDVEHAGCGYGNGEHGNTRGNARGPGVRNRVKITHLKQMFYLHLPGCTQ